MTYAQQKCLHRKAFEACRQHSLRGHLHAFRVYPNRSRKEHLGRGATQCRACSNTPQVVLTRERGKNQQLAEILSRQGISWLELPLIESAPGPDREKLAATLQEEQFDWVTITSPEAAAVFLDAWRSAGRPKVQIAVVGEGSGRVIETAGAPELLSINFTPSKANAVHLSAEIPLEGNRPTVLYPSSAKAGTDLQAGLIQRGVSVTRLNTYDTVPVRTVDPEQLQLARQAAVLTVASPSAVKAWVNLAGLQDTTDIAVACIGSTSAKAAEKLGLKRIYCPDAPGLDGLVTSINEALEASRALLATG